MSNAEKIADLIRWRIASLKGKPSAHKIVGSLSCEGLPDANTPDALRDGVRAFRKLRADRRLAVVRTAMAEGHPSPNKKSFIAVCGFVSEKFDNREDACEWVNDRLTRHPYPRGFVVSGDVLVVTGVRKP